MKDSKLGDKVKAKKGSQAGSFRQYETKVGTIVKDYKDGDFKVNFGGSNDASIAGKDLVKESVDLEEKNVPTNPKLWAKFKAQAKAKFDVYPSAYANGWVKKYKSGRWWMENHKGE